MHDTAQRRRGRGTGHCCGSPSVLSARTVSQRGATASHHHGRLIAAMVVVLTVGGGVFPSSRVNDNNSAAAAAWHSAAAPIQVAAAVDVSSRRGGGGAFLSLERAFQKMSSRQTIIGRHGDTAQLSATGVDTAEGKLDSGVSFVESKTPPGHFECVSTDCAKYITYDSAGRLISDGPDDYGANEFAEFAVWGPVRLIFLEQGIEYCTHCSCDVLKIHGILHCGSRRGGPVELPSGKHFITWKTNDRWQAKGFVIAIQLLGPPSTESPAPSNEPNSPAPPAPTALSTGRQPTTAAPSRVARTTAPGTSGTNVDYLTIGLIAGGVGVGLLGIAAIAYHWRRHGEEEEALETEWDGGGQRQQPWGGYPQAGGYQQQQQPGWGPRGPAAGRQY